MDAQFYSLISILNGLMWSEGPQAWRVMRDIEEENNQ